MNMFVLLLGAILLWITNAQELSSRIVGGEAATAGQFPFAAAIYVRKPEGTYFCGGTIVHHQWVLTSGQCAENAVSFIIYLGSNSLSGDDLNRVTLATSEYVLHPDYDPLYLRHDLGLIKLRMPLQYTDYMKSIDFFAASHLEDGTEVIAIGWGQQNDQDPQLSNVLQHVNLTTLSTIECRSYYGNQITDEMVCLAGNYNEGSCIGDMGSPILERSGWQYVIVGVASFLSGNGCESLDPSGYTRTYHYVDWIMFITDN